MSTPREAAYTISTEPGRAGTLERIACPSEREDRHGTCWEVIAGAAAPCAGCPALDPDPARTVGVVAAPSGDQVLVTAHKEGGSATIRRVVLTSAEVDLLVEDRLRRLATAALLTNQETRVAERMVRGDSVQHIADELGIAVRTVKFHQGRAFRKLHVNARYELAGLVLSTESRGRS